MTNSIAYFIDGELVDVFPRNSSLSLYDDRGTAYHARFIVSDGRKYDLWDAKSVNAIPCPKFGSGGGSTTFSLDYILRMCASNIRNAGYNELSIIVLRKATQLMPYSGIGWSEKDYLRIVQWLYRDGRIDEGDKVRNFILTNETIQSKENTQRIAIQNFQRNSKNGLVMYSSYSGLCCEICAKYSGRVYRTSWSWANRKYPMLPKFLADCGCQHIGCNSGTAPFEPSWGGTVYYLGERLPLAKGQARPYRDERTEEDKLKYEQTIARIKQEDENEHLDRLREYHLLKTKLPEGMMPKSLSAYTKIKNANTEQYQAITTEAKSLGLL